MCLYLKRMLNVFILLDHEIHANPNIACKWKYCCLILLTARYGSLKLLSFQKWVLWGCECVKELCSFQGMHFVNYRMPISPDYYYLSGHWQILQNKNTQSLHPTSTALNIENCRVVSLSWRSTIIHQIVIEPSKQLQTSVGTAESKIQLLVI